LGADSSAEFGGVGKRLHTLWTSSPHQVALEGSDSVEAARDAAASSVDPGKCVELLLRPKHSDDTFDTSVFTVSAFASHSECESLIASSHELISMQIPSQDDHDGEKSARKRLPIAASHSAMCQHSKLIRRLLSLFEAQLAHILVALCGQDTDLLAMRRRYSAGEPAINIYEVHHARWVLESCPNLASLSSLGDPNTYSASSNRQSTRLVVQF
jgi:hypothetical protein